MKRKILLVLGLVSASSLLLTNAPKAAAAPVIKPVLDFEFNEGKGLTTTDTVAKIVGTFQGYAAPVVITTNSPSGTAGDQVIGFNLGLYTNNSCLVVDDSNNPILAFATNAPFTMEAWVNREVGDTNTYEGIGGYGFSYKMGLGQNLGTNGGEFVFTLFGIIDCYSGYHPPEGEWHHLAAAWTPGTGVALYHDGILITNYPTTSVPRAYQFNTLSIGAEQPGNTGFHGMIGRFRIEQGALAVTNLDSNPTNPAPVTTNTVVAYSFSESMFPFQSSAATARPAVPYDPTGPTFVADTPSGRAGDYALSFTNIQQVVVPDPTTVMQLDTNNPSFTMQAWVKFSGMPTNREVFFYANGPGGAVSFSVDTNRTVFVTTLGIKDQASNAAIPNDTNWHNIAVVHQNGSNFLFYVDGALADTQAYTNGVIFTRTNQVFYIGSESTFGHQYLGKLDRLKVTSGVLAPADLDYHALPGPQLLASGGVDSGVGLTFDRPVDPTTATNTANYTVTGAKVEGVTLFEGQYVALQLAGVPGAGFTITVNGVKDLAGNVINGTVSATGQAGDLTSADIGTPGVDPLQPGFAAGLGNGGYLVAGGGSDIYGDTDGFHFVYAAFSGAFDVRVRVEWMNPIGTGDVWAKAGLMVRETLDAGSPNVHLHATRSDGQNGVYFTWRDVADNATTSTGALETPEPYPNLWLRLVRPDPTTNVFLAYYSTNGGSWVYATNHTIPGKVLPDKVYVGMTVTEHDNTATVPLALTVFQQFSLTPYPSVLSAARTYGLGFKLGADAATTAPTKMAPGDVAGVPGVAQANWNNLNGASGTNGPIGTNTTTFVGDLADDTATNTHVVVTYTANGTWASTGESEENNQFPPGPDRTLMTGYLDTGDPTTTSVTLSNLPPQLTSGGYDLYIYFMGGTDNGRYGGYRVLDAASGAVLKDYVVLASSSNATGFIEAPASTNVPPAAKGNYFVFSGLTATNITIQATTSNTFLAGFRAPLNAVQLVAPSSAVPPPAVPFELGQTVNGFQDDFSGFVRDPNWIPVGPGGDHYQQLNGVLHVTTMSGDPNHLIYVGPGGSNTTQEVLARLRVVNFGVGDPSRGGIGTCVSTGVTSHVTDWIGINLNLRNNSENFNGGPTSSVHFKMLDDLRSWGPQTSYGWTKDTWYWERLKFDPTKPDGTNNVFAKTWLADGQTPEPATWDIVWNDTQTPTHGGWAGITGTSAGGLSEFEVSYVLIKCASLPKITVDFSVAPLPNAYVRSVSPAMGAASVDPNADVQAVLVDGANPIDPKSITMMLNNTPVAVNVSKVADVATVTYVPDGLYTPNDTINVTLGYVENGEAMSAQWSFSVAPYTRDVLHGYIGAIEGPAFFSPNGGGHTGKPGDYAINFGESGAGTSVRVADGGFLNLAAASDVMSISLWVKRLSATISTNDVATNSSAFCAVSPSSSGDESGYQAQLPWNNKNIYFDTAGCCDGTLERINASITNFPGYQAVGNDGFWTNWHNLVFVKDTTNKFIYIDGALFLKGTNTAALPQDFSELYMGSDATGGNLNLKGLIDDFAIYSSAVSAADAALLAGGTPPNALAGETLLAYWDFDDAADSSLRSYSIGLHFGADEVSGANTSTLASNSVAGVPSVMQANWNNLKTATGTNVTNIVSDYIDNTSSTTLVSVSWSSPNTWSTTGRGEENNAFPAGPDHALMTGYLDTVSAGTTTVTISNLPPVLTAHGYSVYVYAMGSVVGRSGGYRILDAGTGAVLTGYLFATATSNMVNYVQAPVSINPAAPGVGNYMVFSGLTASNIMVQATTANGLGGSGTPRAPIQAIQLVAPPAGFAPPAELAVSISVTPAGLVVRFTGTLQSADQLTGPWTDVPATSPLTITPSAAMKFYRARN
jgi:hypothetical protein